MPGAPRPSLSKFAEAFRRAELLSYQKELLDKIQNAPPGALIIWPRSHGKAKRFVPSSAKPNDAGDPFA